MDKPANARTPESETPPFSIWQLLGLLAGPLLFLFVYFLVRPDGMPLTATAVLASTAWVCTWWITRAMPAPVTGLLPLVLFPVLDIAETAEAAAPYTDPTVCLLLGGILVALAGERWNLYHRIALNVIARLGASPGRLVLGFLSVTAVLSTWISSAVSAVLMLPIGLAVSAQMTALQKPHQGRKVIAINGGLKSNFGPALILSIAYGASFGGIAAQAGPRAGFLQWALVAAPITLLSVVCGWFTLRTLFPPETPGGKEQVRQDLTAMGPLSRQEKWALTALAVVSVMWISRPYLITPYLPKVGDATIAIFGAVLLFVIPTNLPQNQWLLTTEALRKVPWGLLLLFGAGFAIAGAFQSSGLSQWIAAGLPPLPAGTGHALGTAALGLAVTAAVGSGHIPLRQIARAGLWLNAVGAAVIAFCAYVWLPIMSK